MCHNRDVKHFTSAEVKKLFPEAILRRYPAGQIVIYDGDQPSHIFFIKKGAIKNYDIDDQGNEKIVRLIGENGFFPLIYALSDALEIENFYSTLDETEVLLIPIEQFIYRCENDIVFSNRCFRWFVGEATLLLDRIKGLERTESRLKVAQVLEYLANQHAVPKNENWQQVKFPVSQQFVADMVGLTRETVSVIMKDFDEQKIVHFPRQMHLEIHMKRLRQLT